MKTINIILIIGLLLGAILMWGSQLLDAYTFWCGR